VFSGF